MSAATAAAAAAPILASLEAQAAPASSVEAAAAHAPAAVDSDSDAMKDLERLFRIRDQELGMRVDNNPAPVGYEATRPSPL
jgi:hypothetical protein